MSSRDNALRATYHGAFGIVGDGDDPRGWATTPFCIMGELSMAPKVHSLSSLKHVGLSVTSRSYSQQLRTQQTREALLLGGSCKFMTLAPFRFGSKTEKRTFITHHIWPFVQVFKI